MSNGIRWIVLGAIGLLMLGLAPGVSSAGDQIEIVVQGGPGFLVETPDGTVTASVATAPGTEAGDYSAAANGSIAYASSGPVGGIWVVGPNQAPFEVDSAGSDVDVAISPDGSKVAFDRVDSTTNTSDLYVVGADGSDLTLVASGDGNNNLSSPSFSPDGSTIAYLCRAGNYGPGTGIGCGPTAAGTYLGAGLMLVRADGSDRRMVLSYTPGTQGDTIAWSPDAQSITVTGSPPLIADGQESFGPEQIFVYRTDGSDLLTDDDPAHQLTDETGPAVVDPQFGPDGSTILFSKLVDSGWVLYSIAADGTNEHALSAPDRGQFAVVPPPTGGEPPPTVNVIQPLPAPDGTVVIPSWIIACKGYLVQTAVAAFTACIPGHGREDFYSNTSIAVASNYSVVYSDLSAGPGGADGPIWLSRPDAAPVELDSDVHDFEPSISSDGSKVAFARDDPKTGGSDIYTINADGSGLKLVASGTGTSGIYMSNPTLSPDGRAIAYDCSSIDKSYAENNQFCGPLFDGTFRAGGLMLMKADGSEKQEIVNRAGENISWSPDGRWLATEGQGGQIFAYRTDGSDLFMGGQPSRQITGHTDPQDTARDPQFSPDGSRILYQTSYDDNGDSSGGPFSYEIGRDGTNRHEVFLAPPDVGFGIPGLFVPQPGGGGPAPLVTPTQAPVPDVTALGYHMAKAKLAARELTAKVTGHRYSSWVRRGHVIAQFPRKSTLAQLTGAEKPIVKLVLSRGKRPPKQR